MGGQVKNYNVAIVKETVPGTYEAPTVGGDFVEMSEPPTINTDQEILERSVVRGGLGQLKSRRGLKIATQEIPFELKSSGSIGVVDPGLTDPARLEQVFEAALGGKTRRTANDTVSGGLSTTTVIDTTLNDYEIGEGVGFFLPGGLEISHVKSIPGANQIELFTPLSAAPADATVILRGSTIYSNSADDSRYSVTSNDEPAGSTTIQNRLFGMVLATLAMTDMTNGSIPKVNTTWEGIDWDVLPNIVSGVTPSFENSVPPDNLNVLMNIGGIDIDSNGLTLTIEKEVAPKKVITNNSGVLERVPTSRKISGSFDYYPDVTDLTLFDNFKDNDTIGMHFALGNVDAALKFLQGTIVSVYLPSVQLTTGSPDEEDGFIKRTANFNSFEEAVLDRDIFVFFA